MRTTWKPAWGRKGSTWSILTVFWGACENPIVGKEYPALPTLFENCLYRRAILSNGSMARILSCLPRLILQKTNDALLDIKMDAGKFLHRIN
jgi:hypothetical protein